MGWQLYALTGSALDLGLVGLVQFLPMVLLTLVVGQVADRYDRRAIVSCCQVLQAAAAALLALGSAGGWLRRESILALVALVGAARAFEGPTMAALMPGLVPRPPIPRAAAWAISATQTAQIVGPALGGLLYLAGPGAVYGAAAALFVLAGVCTATIRIAGALRDRAAVTLPPLFSGITFIAGTPILLGTLSLDLFAVLLGGATALLPIYAADILAAGPWGSGSCARPPRWARWPCRSFLVRASRSSAGSARGSSAPCSPSAPPRWCSGSPPACRSRSSRSPCWAAPTWSAW